MVNVSYNSDTLNKQAPLFRPQKEGNLEPSQYFPETFL